MLRAQAPGERGVAHLIDEFSYLGGGMVRAACGLWSGTWQVAVQRAAVDCPRCVARIELREADAIRLERNWGHP